MRFAGFLKLVVGVAALLPAVPGWADTVYIGGIRYSGTVVGIKNGKLAVTVGGADRPYDLENVDAVNIDAVPKFADAEQARVNDAKAAAALYKQIIPTLNKPELKQFAQWRAIEPTDADGRWAEAVGLFLEVYQANPTEGVWKGRPTHMPNAGSTLLAESAEKVAGAIKAAKSEEVRKNLKGFLLDIYTKAGDVQAAQRLAREISTGIVEETPAAVRGGDNVLAMPTTPALLDIENAIRAKNYDAALRQADGVLGGGATGETAVQVFSLKAQAYEAQNKPEDAVAALLRITAHYPDSPAAPAALLRAGDLDKKLNRPEAAKALYRELVEKYPASKEAALAKAEP